MEKIRNWKYVRRKISKILAWTLVMLMLLNSFGLSTLYAADQIVIDGNTLTTLDINGNLTDIRTGTILGGVTGLNSFSKFDVNTGNIVNLHVPGGATNLINLVNGPQSQVNGILNSMKDGKIGGNIFFLNPNGMLIGNGASVNVGSLSIITPTQSFMDKLSLDNPLIDEGTRNIAINSVLTGRDVPLNSSGSIVVKGRINALDGVRLQAGDIAIGNKTVETEKGIIQTGVKFNDPLDFANIVNTTGLQKGGSIEISANGEISINGDLAAQGGNISVSGKNVEISKSILSTRQLDRETTNAGDDSILSSGDSGSLTIIADQSSNGKASIDISSAKLISFANNGKMGGDVSVEAKNNSQLYAWAINMGPSASIDVSDSTLKGSNVSLKALANNDALFDPEKNTGTWIDNLKDYTEKVTDLLANIRLGAVGTKIKAESEINLNSGTKIMATDSAGKVDIKADANSKISTMNFSTGAAVGVGISDATAKINLGNNVSIDSQGDVSLQSKASNTISQSNASMNMIEALPFDIAVSYTEANSESAIKTESGSKITAKGNVNIVANNEKTINNSVSSSGGKDFLGAAVAINNSDSKTIVEVAGGIKADKDINVQVNSNTKQNSTTATSIIGDGYLDPLTGPVKNFLMDKTGAANLIAKVKMYLLGPPTPDGSVTKFLKQEGIDAAVGVALESNLAEAKITSTQDAVSAGKNLSVNALITDRMQNAVIAEQKPATTNDGSNPPTTDTKKDAAAAAVFYGQYHNDAKAFIGENALADAGEKITIQANTKIPVVDNYFPKNEDGSFDLATFLTKRLLADNGGIPQAFFTSWAQSSSTAQQGALAASVNLMNVDNKANAYIGSGAKINQSADTYKNGKVELKSGNDVETTNLAGVFKFPLANIGLWKPDQALEKNLFGNEGGKAGIGGSVIAMLYKNEANASIASGVKLDADNLTVNAENYLKDVSLAAAGGKSESVGFNGSFSIANVTNKTVAQIDENATIKTKGRTDIKAKDQIDIYNISGGVTEGGNVGIGASVAINQITRDTKGIIGSLGTTVGTGSLTADTIGIEAKNSGLIGSVALAGAETQDQPPSTPTPEDQTDPLDGISLPALFGETPVSSGVAIAGDVAYNTFNDTADAIIRNAKITLTGTASLATPLTNYLRATNDNSIWSLAGGAALSLNKGNTSVGIAGSATVNKMDNQARAYLDNTTITVNNNDFDVEAQNQDKIKSLAASGAAAPNSKGVGLAGSVTVNKINNTTQAYLKNSALTTTNADSNLKAADTSSILSVAGAASYGGTAGVGASVAVNLGKSDTQAYLLDSDAQIDGSLSIAADNKNEVTTVSASIGASKGKMAANGAATVTVLDNKAKASITGQKTTGTTAEGNISVKAKNDVTLEALAGGAAVAGGTNGAGIGASAEVSTINNTAEASIGKNTAVTAKANKNADLILASGEKIRGLAVNAINNGDYTTIAAGGAGSGGAGIAGSASTNVITDTTKAYLADGVKINQNNDSNGSVNLAALDNTKLTSGAGALAVGAGTAGIGVGADVGVITKTTEAYLDDTTADVNGTQVKAKGNVQVKAESTENITSISAGIAGGKSVGLAGAASVQTLTDKTRASLGQNTQVATDGSVEVSASDENTMKVLAGNLAVSGGTAVGAGAAVNIVNKDTQAYLDNGARVEAKGQKKGLVVTATGKDDLIVTAVGVAGGKDVALEGSAATNVITNKTKAYLGEQVKAHSSQEMLIMAGNTYKYDGAGGALAVSGTGGSVGAGVHVSVLNNTTEAYIGKGAEARAQGDLLILAQAEEDLLAGAVAGGLSAGYVGFAGGVGVNTLNNNTSAHIDENAKAKSGKNIKVEAQDLSKLVNVAGGVGIGAQGGGAGAAVNVSVINKKTNAFIGQGAEVDGTTGVAVNAVSKEDLNNIILAGGGGEYVGVAGAVGVNYLNSDTNAYLAQGSKINQDSTQIDEAGQSVQVTAKNQINSSTKTGALSGAGGAALSGAVDVMVIQNDTTAYVGDNTKVNAQGGIAVTAQGKKELDSKTISAGVSGIVGLAGSVSVYSVGTALDLSNKSVDGKSGSAVLGGNTADDGILPYADQQQKNDITSNLLAGYNSQEIKDTKAKLAAQPTEDVSATLNNSNTTGTTAYIGDGTQVTGSQLTVTANEELKVTQTTGAAAAAGQVAIGAAVNVANLQANTNAHIGAAKLTATQGNIAVKSKLMQDYTSSGIAATASMNPSSIGASLAGSLTYMTDKSQVISYLGDDSTVTEAHNTATDKSLEITAQAEKKLVAKNIGASVALNGPALSGTVVYGVEAGTTKAYLGKSTITRVDDLNITADNKLTMSGNAIAPALGYYAGVGAAVVVLTDDASSAKQVTMDSGNKNILQDTSNASTTSASIAAGAKIIEANNIQVNALYTPEIKAETVGAGAGAVGLGASVAYSQVAGKTTASIGDGVQIGQTAVVNSVSVNSKIALGQDKYSANSSAVGVAIGAFAGNGTAAVSKVDAAAEANISHAQIKTKNEIKLIADRTITATSNAIGVSGGIVAVGLVSTTAGIQGATIAKLGGSIDSADLIITANSQDTAEATSKAGAAGLAAGSGTLADAKVSTTTQANTEDNASIKAKDVTVQAQSTPKAKAEAKGLNLGEYAVGVSQAQAQVAPTLNAYLGLNNTLTANSLKITANSLLDDYTAKALSNASGGGLIGVNATFSRASNNTNLNSYIGDGSSLTVTDNLDILSSTKTKQAADSDATTIGIVAVGANLSTAESNTTTQAYLGKGLTVNGKNLTVKASGEDDNQATAISGTGGAIAAAAAKTTTNSTSKTKAYLADSDSGNQKDIKVNLLNIEATHNSLFNTLADSTRASLVGGSGSVAENRVTADVEAIIGANNTVITPSLTLKAENSTKKDWLNIAANDSRSNDEKADAAKANNQTAAGSLIDGASASSTTTVNQTTKAQVGDNSEINIIAPADKTKKGQLNIDALNNLELYEKSVMNTGGAVTVPKMVSKINVVQNDATINLGKANIISDSGDLKIGTKSKVNIMSTVAVDAYGLAGQPDGTAQIDYVGNNTVNVAEAKLTAKAGNVILGAGEDSQGNTNQITATGKVNLWNKTAVPQVIAPTVNTNVTNNNSLNIGSGTSIESAGDITLSAVKGTVEANAKGIAKDPYRETGGDIINGISGLFGGGKVSLDIISGSKSIAGSSNVVVNGKVQTGLNRNREITIESQLITDVDGNPILDKDGKKQWTEKITGNYALEEGKDYTIARGVPIDQAIEERINQLRDLKTKYAGDETACNAYEAEIQFLIKKREEIGLTKDGRPGTGAGMISESPLEAATKALTAAQNDQLVVVGKINQVDSRMDNLDKLDSAFTSYKNAVEAYNLEKAAEHPDATKLSSLATEVASKGSLLQNQITIVKNQTSLSSVTVDVGKLNSLDAAITAFNTNKDNTPAFSNYTDLTKLEKDGLSNLTTTLASQKTALDNNITYLHSITDETINGLPNSNRVSDVVPSKPTTNEVTINDLTVKTGTIRIKADNLSGSGKLLAPSDASIKITNNTPDILKVRNLTVNDEGGRVTLNGFEVNNGQDVQKINLDQNAVNLTLETKYNSPNRPKIIVTSTYDPLDGSNQLLAPAPATYLTGTVINSRGDFIVDSAAGDIYVNDGIQAGTVNIATKRGDFVLSYANPDPANSAKNFLNVGGDPAEVDNASKNVTRGTGILANGSILISSRYINVNGTIQSGIADWNLVIPEDPIINVNGTQTKLSAIHSLAPGKYPVVDAIGNMSVIYDSANNRFEVNPASVEGGYVELIGQIMNTAADGKNSGKINVLDGYGQFNITNNSNRDLVINALNTGRGTAGVIKIKDLQRSDVTVTPIKSGKDDDGSDLVIGSEITTTPHYIETTITRDNGKVTTTQKGRWTYNADGLPSSFDDNYTTSFSNDGRTSTYNPQTGLRYVWTTGTDYSTTTDYYYSGNRYFYSDSLIDITDKRVTKVSGPYIIDQERLPDGTYLLNGQQAKVVLGTNWNNNNQQEYITNNDVKVSSQQTITRERVSYPWWSYLTAGTISKYERWFTETDVDKKITTHYVKADNPIGINFIGADTGTININSAANNVLLNGNLTNLNGKTEIAGRSIMQNNDSSMIKTNNLVLNATNGIGDTNAAIRTALDGGTLEAIAQNGSLVINQLVGDTKLGQVTADKGTVSIVSDGSISQEAGKAVSGKRIELTAVNGGIGSDSTALVIKAGSTTSSDANDLRNVGLKATAKDSINLKNQVHSSNPNGDLLIDTVVSQDGNVKLETPGQMLDNNLVQKIDTRTRDQLLNYWDSLGLLEGNKNNNDKQKTTLAAYADQQKTKYQTYWNDLKIYTEGKYDPSFQYQVGDAEQATLTKSFKLAGVNDADIPAKIAAYAQNITDEYHQLNKEVGSWTNSYDAGFVYQVTQAEKDKLLNGSSWTEQELAVSITPGALKQLSDTNPVLKDANVAGKNVTLLAGKNIGSTVNINIPLSNGKLDVSKLTPEQKVALAAAERSDWETALKNITSSNLVLPTFKPFNIEVMRDGSLTTSANGITYLASEQAVNINQIFAGNNEVRLKAAGSLLNAGTGANIIGGDIIIESGEGSIGTKDKGLQLSNAGFAITARGDGDIYITKNGDEDIEVDTIFSRGKVELSTGGTIKNKYKNKLNINSASLRLNARAIGEADNYLALGLTGALDAQATTDSIYIQSLSNQLAINKAIALLGDVNIKGGGDIIINSVAATEGIQSKAVSITSENGSILHGNGESNKDIVASDGDINLTAKGSIGTKDKLIYISTPGYLTASGEQGVYVKQDGRMKVNTIDSSQGDVLLNAGNLSASTITADRFKVVLDDSDGQVDINKLSVKEAVGVIANKVNLEDVSHTGNQILQLDIAGYNGEMAEEVNVAVKSNVGVNFKNLKANKAIIKGTTTNLSADSIITDNLDIDLDNSNGQIDIKQLLVREAIKMAANKVNLEDVSHTGNQILQLDIAGYNGEMAEEVNVAVKSNVGVNFKNLKANKAIIKGTTTNLSADSIITDNLDIDLDNSNGQIDIKQLLVREAIKMAANKVNLEDVSHTGNQILQLDIAGHNGEIAEEVNVAVQSNVGVNFNRLKANRATVKAATDKLALANTLIGTRADINNNYYRVVVDNVQHQLITSDLQLHPGNKPFFLQLSEERNFNTNSNIINYSREFTINGRYSNTNSVTGVMENLMAQQNNNNREVTLGNQLQSAVYFEEGSIIMNKLPLVLITEDIFSNLDFNNGDSNEEDEQDIISD